MFNHSSGQLGEVALWPVTKNRRLPFGSDKTNLTVTQMLACVDDYDYDVMPMLMVMLMVMLILMLMVMLMVMLMLMLMVMMMLLLMLMLMVMLMVMMLTMAHRLPANDRSSLTVTHRLAFVTAAQAEVGLLAETTYVRSLIHIPINLNGLKITRYAHFVKRHVDCCQDSRSLHIDHSR